MRTGRDLVKRVAWVKQSQQVHKSLSLQPSNSLINPQLKHTLIFPLKLQAIEHSQCHLPGLAVGFCCSSVSVFQPDSSLFQWEMSVYTLMCSGIWQNCDSLGLTFSKWSASLKPLLTGGQSHVCFDQFVEISELATCRAFAIPVYEKWSYCELSPVLVNVLEHLLPDTAPFPALPSRTMCPWVFYRAT